MKLVKIKIKYFLVNPNLVHKFTAYNKLIRGDRIDLKKKKHFTQFDLISRERATDKKISKYYLYDLRIVIFFSFLFDSLFDQFFCPEFKLFNQQLL